MPRLALDDRALLAVSGEDAAKFLQGLLTADISSLESGAASAAALLTPQGKILFDMLVFATSAGFFIDARADALEALAKRLGIYRLRSKVEITLRPDLEAVWTPPCEDGDDAVDPRLPALGRRGWSAHDAIEDGTDRYHQLRVAAGVAEAWADFEAESVFPHEASYDLLHGVSFTKGCFVGQEVVSRMQHRGLARKRFLPCTVEGDIPPRGESITANGRAIGTVGSAAGGHVLALLRLDRLEETEATRTALLAAGSRLHPRQPGWLVGLLPLRAST